MPIHTFPIILKEAQALSPSVKHFTFLSKEEPPFNYLPGQFITIHWNHQDKILRRSYSIANVPTQNNRIEFAAGYVPNGPGSELLFNLKPNDTINISGPFGRLTLKEDNPKRYIFIATSTGITPFRSMIPELKARLISEPTLKIVILQGVQRHEDILYRDDFLDFSAHFPNVMFRAYLSREQNTPPTDFEHLGHVQKDFPTLCLNPLEDRVYLCGNPSMIDDSFSYLKDQGFAMQQIIREKYISSK
ncbi:MAG: ferredoxin--NADP reductase [Legionellales bacterium]|nr:ferredoxin--NADP reductase [Legionellales bacterium]